MNYIKANIGFRYAHFSDLFFGDMATGHGTQFLKENMEYFIFQNGNLYGKYLTPRHSNPNADLCSFTELYLAVGQEMVFIPNDGLEVNALVRKVYLQKATAEILKRNTKFYLYINKVLSGPFLQATDHLDNKTRHHLSKNEVFVLYKISKS